MFKRIALVTWIVGLVLLFLSYPLLNLASDGSGQLGAICGGGLIVWLLVGLGLSPLFIED